MVPDSPDLPVLPEPRSDGATALPDGLEPVPELGLGAIGTRFRDGALTFYRFLSVALTVIAVGTLVLFAPAFTETIWAILVALVVVGLLGTSAVNYHRLASYGRTRPALVITETNLEVLVPFNRMSVDLAAIRDVTVLSRDLIVLAPDGIRGGDRPSRARRAVINNVRSFEVERAQLAAVIQERAREARRPA